MMLGKDTVFSRLKDVIDKKEADQAEAVLTRSESALTRYAESVMHQNTVVSEVQVAFRVAVGRKLGVATVTSLEDGEMTKTLRKAEEIARYQPEQPGFESLPRGFDYPVVDTFYESTAGFSAGKRASAVKRIFDKAAGHDLRVAGALETVSGEMAVVNSLGLEAYQPVTSANISIIAMSDKSSGFADGLSRDVNDLDFDGLAERAVKKCLDCADSECIEPGKYDVILESTALSELLEWMSFVSFSYRSYDDGMSFIEGNEDKKVMGDNVTIYDDGLDGEGIPMPFDFEGVPKRRVNFVKEGRAKDVVYDTISANKEGKESSGHATPPEAGEGAMPLNIFFSAGRSDYSEMIESMERGILVTRFHYVNGLLHPKTALMTGMTRDGTFLVEDGGIRRGLGNLRFNQSMLEALSRVRMKTKERKAVKSWWSRLGAVTCPAVYIEDFNFTGRQDK